MELEISRTEEQAARECKRGFMSLQRQSYGQDIESVTACNEVKMCWAALLNRTGRKLSPCQYMQDHPEAATPIIDTKTELLPA